MGWLIFSGIVVVFTGVLLLLSHDILIRLGEALNRPIFAIDEKLRSIRITLGIILLVIGLWNVVSAFYYPELWSLHLIGVFIIFFGLLYLFVPEWLGVCSWFLDQILLSTDELVMGTRKIFGLALLLAAGYIFYAAYLVR